MTQPVRHGVIVPSQAGVSMPGMRLSNPVHPGGVAACPAPRRICIVTETYPPEVNGVALTLARVVEGLRARGHAIDLVRPRQHAGDAPQASDGLTVTAVAGLPIPRYPGLRFGLPAGALLERLWARHRPDIVHLATEGPLGWSALRAARRLGLPITSDFRTNFHGYSGHYGLGWLHRPIRACLRSFHNRTNVTMVPTDALQRELSAQGFERLSVVARGVDTDLFSPQHRSPALRAHWGVGPHELVVACVGRLAPEKNLEQVIETHTAIRQVHRGTRLLFVGDGPSRAHLQARAPGAFFPGQLSGQNLATHYASADLFLFPSLSETFGNVTLEAMASGLPLVAYDCAAAGEILRHGHDGLLVPVHDAPAFTRAALQLAGDRLLRRAIGVQARHTAGRLGWPRIVEQFERVLMGAMAGTAHDGCAPPQPGSPPRPSAG